MMKVFNLTNKAIYQAILVAALALSILPVRVAAENTTHNSTAVPSLAIMTVEDNSSGQRSFTEGLPDMLITELATAKAPRLVERSRIQEALKELKLENSGLTREGHMQVGKWLGSDHIMMGTLSRANHNLRLDLRVIDVQSGTILFATSSTGTNGDLLNMVQEIGSRVRNYYNPALHQSTVKVTPAPVPVAKPEPQISNDSGWVSIRFKQVLGLFTERPWPMQKVRIFVDGELVGESPVIKSFGEEYVLWQGKLPVKSQDVMLEHGMVRQDGSWYSAMKKQPNSISIRPSKSYPLNLEYSLKVGATYENYRNFKVN